MIAAVGLLSLTFLVSPPAVARDSDYNPQSDADLSGDSAQVWGLGAVVGAHSSPKASSGGSATATTTAAVQYIYEYVDACPGASPTNPTAGCELTISACPPGQYLQWLYRRPATSTTDADWQQVASRCAAAPAAAAAAGQAVTFPGFTATDFRRLPLPAGVAHVQPDTGYVVIDIPTDVYASARQVVLPTTVVGVAVQVRATPSTYTWSFGDGASLGPTEQTGAPYPDLVLTHTYTAPARVSITLTTTYTGEYSVAGGPWLPVDGTASVTSPPVAETVLSGHAALVDGTTAS